MPLEADSRQTQGPAAGPHPAYAGPPVFRINETGETFIFRRSARGQGGRFEFEWRLAPGKVGPGEHCHPEESERFTVREGRLQIFFGQDCHDLGPGDSLTVPAGTAHHFGHPGDAEAVVDVSLDGTRMEDQFLPLALGWDARQGLPLRALPKLFVHLHHAMTAGSSVPTSGGLRAMMAVFAGFFRLFGVRPLPPVVGWER